VYLPADREVNVMIAQANTPLDEEGRIAVDNVVVRLGSDGHRFPVVPAEQVTYMDVSPKQVVSVATACIPFLEHDDANRALMGANMQRQAVPLIRPQSPIVGTGVEYLAARDSGQVVVSRHAGTVVSASGKQITLVDDEGQRHVHHLQKFIRSNQDTCINQRPIVHIGDHVEANQVIADSSSTDQVSSRWARTCSWHSCRGKVGTSRTPSCSPSAWFATTSIPRFISRSTNAKRVTPSSGPEEITRDIPNVGEESLANLDETGIIRIGAEVRPNDILVGKVTPRGENRTECGRAAAAGNLR
jgi:DNA-directed RNA polymerase subunit beta